MFFNFFLLFLYWNEMLNIKANFVFYICSLVIFVQWLQIEIVKLKWKWKKKKHDIQKVVIYRSLFPWLDLCHESIINQIFIFHAFPERLMCWLPIPLVIFFLSGNFACMRAVGVSYFPFFRQWSFRKFLHSFHYCFWKILKSCLVLVNALAVVAKLWKVLTHTCLVIPNKPWIKRSKPTNTRKVIGLAGPNMPSTMLIKRFTCFYICM